MYFFFSQIIQPKLIEAIGNFKNPIIALATLIIVVIIYGVWRFTSIRITAIKKSSVKDPAPLLDIFPVDTKNLSKIDQYNIAIKQINNNMYKFKTLAFTSIIFLLIIIIAIILIPPPNNNNPKTNNQVHPRITEANIKGKIVSFNGRPIEGVTVIINNTNDNKQSVITDDSGFYLFKNIKENKVEFSAIKEGYVTHSTELDNILGGNGTVEYTFVLKANPINSKNNNKVNVEGIVISYTNGKALNDVQVQIIDELGKSVTEKTDNDGRFYLTNIDGGIKTLKANKDGYVSFSKVINLPQKSTSGCSFQMKPIQKSEE